MFISPDPSRASEVTEEFQATLGWAIIDVVFVGYCVGEFVQQDMAVLVNKVR